jgi:hypothetical protein
MTAASVFPDGTNLVGMLSMELGGRISVGPNGLPCVKGHQSFMARSVMRGGYPFSATIRRRPEISRQAQGSLSSDCALSGDDRADTVRGDVNFLGEPVHADAQVTQGLFENLARMNGRQLIGNGS